MLDLHLEPKTVADYLALPDDGNLYELIAGELIMVPPPSTQHQDILGFLFARIENVVRPNAFGKVYMAPVNVFTGDRDLYQPDILFVRKENLHIVRMDGVHGAPDLVVEILSPSNAYYDLRHKKSVYEEIGVREYWIVDPLERSIDCYRNTNAGFEPVSLEQREGRLCSSTIPAFCVEIRDVFDL